MRGPVLDTSKLNKENPLNTGFRVISDYIPNSDNLTLRLDVKIEDRQYGVIICNGEKDTGLATPKTVRQCANFKVNKDDFISALEELINDMKSDN